MPHKRFDAADAADEASRQVLYRQLEGFSEYEPLLCRNPAELGLRPEVYWRLSQQLYLRRLPLKLLVPLSLAVLVLLVFWPVTLGLIAAVLRVLLGLRMLLIPAFAVMLAIWLIHSLKPQS